MSAMSVDKVTQAIKQQIVTAASKAAVPDGMYKKRFPAVVLNLPCTFFSIRTSPVLTAMATNLKFAKKVQHLAALVLERMWLEATATTKRVGREGLFNGMYLRLTRRPKIPDQPLMPSDQSMVLNKYLQVCMQSQVMQ
jgi:hypothetical protein